MSSDELPPTQKEASDPSKHGGFSPGQTLLGRYTLRRILGRGGMGVVWLAHDSALDLDVALKFVPDALLHDRMAIDDLKRETRRCLGLTHPHIVRVYDFIQGDDWAGISMEYVDGGTLTDRRMERDHRFFEADEMAAWVAPLCEALAYAHDKAKLIHRDLKPANLMISKKGDVKLADFGIARAVSDSMTRVTSHSATSGTLTHMSPQQLSGEPPKPSDDIYSLGATIYDLMTGKPPFISGDLVHQVMEKVPPPMAQRREDLGGKGLTIPAAWEETVAACLAKDPEKRPRSAGEIAQRLGLTAKSPTPADAAPTPIESPPRPTAAPPSRTWMAWAAALLMLAALAGWYFGIHVPSERARGGIIVRTEPEGASVTLGGEDSQKSPATFRSLRLGKFPVRVSLDGYDSVELTAEVKADQFVELGPVRLARSVGSLPISSTPDGASYELQGVTEKRSGRTPDTAKDLPTGSYTLSLKHAGWPDCVRTIQIARGANAPVVWEYGPGMAVIRSDPSGAEISIAGKSHGKAPLRLELPSGTHTLIAKYKSWPAQTRVVLVTKGGEATGDFEFASGTVTCTSEPAGAEVFLAGQSLGKTPLTTDAPVGPGSFRAKLNVLLEQTQMLEIRKGATHPVSFQFEFGKLDVKSSPTAATVKVGDVTIGKTPVKSFLVPPGEHTVEVSLAGHASQSSKIRIETGKGEAFSPELITLAEAKWRKIPGSYKGTLDVTDTTPLFNGRRQEPIEVTISGTSSKPIVTFVCDSPVVGRFTVSNDEAVDGNYKAKAVTYSDGKIRFEWSPLAASANVTLDFDAKKAAIDFKNLFGHGSGSTALKKSE